MRRVLGVCLLIAWLGAPAARAAVPPPTSPKLTADIPAQSVAGALAEFARQTGLQYGSQSLGTQRSRAARAGSRPGEALQQLLECSGLWFEFVTTRTANIYAAPEKLADPICDLPSVVVTSRRRAEALDQVPIDIVRVTPQQMELSGIKSMAELGALTPGVEFDFLSSVGSGVYTNMAIRGVTDRHGSETAVFLNDIFLPPVRSNTSGRALPSYFDLDRIEVLRGPQGALYGQNTQGGAIRFVPTEPSLTDDTGLAHAEWAATARGDPTYEAGVASGGPLVSHVLGYRVSAWYRTEGGYIDRVDPFTGAVVDANADRTTSKSARAALTFVPGDQPAISITPSVDYESTAARDSRSFFTYLSDPGSGELNNGSLLRQPASDAYYLGTLRVTYNNTVGELRSVTAYFDRTGSLIVDDTESIKWGGWGNPLGLAYPSAYSDLVMTTIALTQRRFAQELQLASSDPGSPFAWVGALLYSDERYREADRVTAMFIPVLQAPLDSSNTTTTEQKQFAAFGELTRRMGRVTLNVGLRIERDAYDSSSIAPPVFQAHDAEVLAVPRLALSYDAGAHTLVYLSAAKGYSPSGVDAALPTCFENPMVYPTDTVWSYELGIKSALDEGRAHLNASVFQARWNNGSVATGNCLFRHMPGRARSNGFDLKAEAVLGEDENGKVALDLSYTDARYTQTVEQGGVVIVREGDAVGTPPLVTSPWNVTASIERRIPAGDRLRARVRAEDTFHSRNPGPFYTSDPASPFYAPGLVADPATNLLNLRADVERGQLDVALYLNNILDSQPTLLKRNKGNDLTTLYYATTFRPRTVGLSGTWRF
jgi:outer membrane receptor protein involved in Fe transport